MESGLYFIFPVSDKRKKTLIVFLIIVEDEGSELLNKVLQIIKVWNLDISQKYGLVDFNTTGEILGLGKVFDGIEIILCDFHREQSWQRWVNKKSYDVFMIAYDVKCNLHGIANSQTADDCEKAIW